MLKVVLDTNVIVSGFNFMGGKPAKILDLVIYGYLVNFVSSPIIQETRNTLIRKFAWSKNEAEAAVGWLTTYSKVVTPQARLTILSQDDSDNRILECALEAEADYIITGDRHLLNLQNFQEINIINPAAFLQLFKE